MWEPQPQFHDANGVIDRICEASAAGDSASVANELFTFALCWRWRDHIEHLGSSVWLAIENGHYEVVQYLLQRGAPTTTTAAMVTTNMKDRKALDLLLSNR